MRYFLGPIIFLLAAIAVVAQNAPSSPKQAPAKPKPKTVVSQKPLPAKTKTATAAKRQPGKRLPVSGPKSPANNKLQTAKTATAGAKKAQLAAQRQPATQKSKISKAVGEGEEYTKAAAVEGAEAKIAAIKAFLEKFPESKKKPEALELIAITRIKLAQDMLTAAETEDGIALLKTAVEEMPGPISEKLYNDTISKIPSDLFDNGQRSASVDIASLIETKIGGNASQLLNLAQFYLMTENGSEAKALAEKAIAIAPSSPAYQTLGLANRLNFQLDDASQAYAKALELEPDSLAILRSLADLKRAQGKSDEAIDLYKRILERDAASAPARTGLILALFDSGKPADAQAEMTKSLEETPGNVILLAGAAYWYAAHNEPDKAIDYSLQAIVREPRYVWSYIALAHGYLTKGQPADAEQALLKGRIYGNFPTLEYEIASARLMSGFYRDAVDELRKSFSIQDGVVHTKLGGRVDSEQKDFIHDLADERRASIFEPESADDQETATRLKALFEFDQIVNSTEPNEDAAAKAADTFVAGDDRMKLHRQLYAASSLLNKRIALPKVAELARSAVGNTESALDVPDPGAAVMASELYDSRTLAQSRGELIKVPQVPRATLSAILRGRIEEIAGWTLFYQDKPAEAVVRLRRAVSVMPEKSAWWRSSMWKLGAALQADGNDNEALDSYIKSYSIDKPDGARYAVVESLYKKLKGNTEGLEAKIGANPMPAVAPTPEPTAVAKNIEPEPSSAVQAPASAKTHAIAAKTDPAPPPESTAAPTPEPSPTKIAEATPTPAGKPLPTPEMSVSATPEPSPTATVEPAPVATLNPAVKATPKPQQAVAEPSLSPSPAAAEPTLLSITNASIANRAVKPSTSASPTAEQSVENNQAGKIDPNTAYQLADPAKKPDDSSIAGNTAKTLFEPIIITIPRRDTPRKQDTAKEKKASEIDPSSAANDPKKAIDQSNEGRAVSDDGNSGEQRQRTIADKEGPPNPATCTISISQAAISILNNGGSLGVLVHMEGDGDLRSIKAASNSPDDVQVTLEPEIAGVKRQAFYVVHSLTPKTGEFKVAFIAPCGRKEMSVTVR